MSVEASSWAWRQPVKGNAKLVLLALADHADRDGVCWPGQKGIAAKCGISERTVREMLGQLECDGYVSKVEWRREDGGQGANRYTLQLEHPPADSAAPPAKARQAPPAEVAGAPRQNGVARVEPSVRTIQKEPSPVAQLVREQLVQVASSRGVSAPSVEAIERALDEFPDRDHVAVARDLAFWAEHGNGRRRRSMAIANTYRNFLKRAEPRAAGGPERFSAYDRTLN